MRSPVPRQQFVDAAGGMSGDAGQHVGQPGLGIDVVEFCGDDEAVEDGGTLAAAVGTGEQPCLSAESQPAQGALGGIVGQADPAVVEEAGEGIPPLQHVIHGDGDVGVARQLATLLAHPCFEFANQRRTEFLANGEPPIGRQPVDGAFDLEQGVDPPDRFQRDRREGSGRAAPRLASGVSGDIGEDEELAAGMAPARRLQDGARTSAVGVQLAVATIGIGLEDTGPGGERGHGR